jgi:hypothetical protein
MKEKHVFILLKVLLSTEKKPQTTIQNQIVVWQG